MLSLELEVVWPDHRSVRVSLRGHPMQPTRSIATEGAELDLPETDVETKAKFIDYLRKITLTSADQSSVTVGAWEKTVSRVYEVLGILGPPPKLCTVNINPIP